MAAKDIPLDAPGIPWQVWHEQQIERIFAEAREKRKQQVAPATTISEKTHASKAAAPSCNRDEDRLLAISPYDE